MTFNYKCFMPSVLALASLLGTAPSSFAGEGGTAGAAAFKIDSSTGNVSEVAAAAAIGKKSAFAGSFVSGITGDLEAFALGTGNSFWSSLTSRPYFDGEGRHRLYVRSNQEGGGTAGAVSFGLDPSTGNVIQVAAAAAIGKKSAFARSTGYLGYNLSRNHEAVAVGTEGQLEYKDVLTGFGFTDNKLSTFLTSSDGEGGSTAGAAAFKLDPTTGNVIQVAAAAAIGKTALVQGTVSSDIDARGQLKALAVGTGGNLNYDLFESILYSTTLDGEGDSTAGAAAFKLDPSTGNVIQVAAAAAIGKTALASSAVSGITGGLEAYALGTGSLLSYETRTRSLSVGSDGEGGGTAGAAAFKIDPSTGNVSQVAAAAAIGEKSAFAGSAVSGITGGLNAYALGTESSLLFQSQILSATDPDDSFSDPEDSFSEVGEIKPKSEKIRLSTGSMSNLATLQANIDDDSGTAGAAAFKLDPTTGNVIQVAAAAAIGEKSAFAGSAVSGITGGLEAYALGTESSLSFQSQILSATYIDDPFFGLGEIEPESEKIRLSTDPMSNLATLQANTVDDEDSGTAGATAFRLDDFGNVSEGVVAAAIGKKSAFAGSTASGITGGLIAYALGTGSSVVFRGLSFDSFFDYANYYPVIGQRQRHHLSVSADGEGGGTAGAAAFRLDFSGNISQVAAAAAIGEKSALASGAIWGLKVELNAFSLGTDSKFSYGNSSGYRVDYDVRSFPKLESHGVAVYSDESSTNTINLLAVDPSP
jgi:hypothetical protein